MSGRSRHSLEEAESVTNGIRRTGPSADDRTDSHADRTGPLVAAVRRSGDASGRDLGGRPLSTRHGEGSDGGDGRPRGRSGDPAAEHAPDTEHPSAPLPPRPAGVWDRLSSRPDGPEDDDQTVASPLVPAPPSDRDGDATGVVEWDEIDQTGGLEVIGAHVGDDGRGRRGFFRRGRRAEEDDGYRDGAPGDPALERDVDDLHDDELHDDDIPVAPYDARSGLRRRRRPLALVVSLLVLAGLVAGIVIGGQQLLGLVNPAAQDFTGQGSGEAEIRVNQGDTLSDIARSLVDGGVIASVEPFVEAAEADPAAMGIQPGVYGLRQEMSGQAALDLLLDPAARLVTRLTIPEGLTVEATFARIAETTGISVEELTAAAADPAALGLPAYANGQLEGFLFPATYEVEPDTAPAEILRRMVAQFTEVAARLQLEQRAAAIGRSPYEVVVIASMIQSETLLDEERPDVAQVIYNRLAQGIPLGIDATLAYGLDKNGNELTVTDLRTDGPFNTRTRSGLPPTPISSPGELSLEAALSPSTGTLLYYVLESSDGRHFFTDDYDEFLAARQRCAEAGLGCGG